MITLEYKDILIKYYKYKSQIQSPVDCIKEYPLTEEILKYIPKNNPQLELKDGKPKLIDGFAVVLV